jgi:serine protease Do
VLADEPANGELPAAFAKTVPETPQDLLAIQKHVQALVKKLQPATVGVRVGGASGSGVIVSKDGYVLTAGHVSGTPNRDAQIILSDGRTLKGKSLGRNQGIDSGMIKITAEGEYPFIEMGNSGELKKGDWCMAIGHPGGVKPGRTAVVRLGRVLDTTKSLVRTDCTLVGGDSGGPLFDMHGKIIGIHSRIGPFITSNIHVPVDTYRETWDRLAKAEEWGTSPFGGKPADVYMGVVLEYVEKGGKIRKVEPESPADKAGLMVDDIITKLDGKQINNQEEVNRILRKRKANDEITLDVLRGEANIAIRVKLEKRPTGK